LIATILASSTYNGFAKPLTSVLSPLSLLFLSELLMGFFVVLSFGFLPTFRALFSVRRRFIVPLIAIGVLSSVLGPLFWFIGLHLSGAISASLVGKADLIIMIVLGHVLLGEKISKHHIASVSVILSGLLLVSYNNLGGFGIRLGDFVILLSVLSFALGSIVFRKYLHDIAPQTAILARSLTAVFVFLVLAPFLPQPFIAEIGAMPLSLVPALLGFAFIARFLNIFMYYQAVDRLPLTTVSICCTLDIVGSMFFAFWFLGENLEWYHLAGGLCVIAGNILLELHGPFDTKKHQELHLKQRVSHRP
jgi:drug/metabolite transporter (DMT)-like permease